MATEQHSASPRGHTDRTGIRSAINLPLFDALADPAVVARLAAEAEEAGWHGVFVWDHVRWNAPIQQVADPWITMAAIATATERVRIGPMVTPLPRRRPVKVARETATLDRLSGGRLILGVGIGLGRFAGEFSKTGEQVDDRVRGEMLTRHWRSSPPPGRASRYTTTAPTTPSTTSSSFPGRCSSRGYRCGPRHLPETATRCAGPPAATACSPPTSTTPMSSPPPSPRLPRYVGPRAGRTTSPSACRSASTRRPSPRPAP